MTKPRPEYVACIQHTHAEKENTSWCGRTLSNFEWCFQDIDHAAYNIMSRGMLVPCPDCVATIIGVLKND